MKEAPLFLLIETATECCSVALSRGESLINEKYINSPKVHASILAPFIRDILVENKLSISELNAVAVSEGPGSYTGLRVGASCAKGICFGSNIPLIGVSTLAAIAQMVIDSKIMDAKEEYIIAPMIDAGRMEVYTAIFSSKGKQITNTSAMILDENSFSNELNKCKVIFTGNGAQKFFPLVSANPNAILQANTPHASGLRVRANEIYSNGEFKDSAYFEPFYLKDFIPGKPKKIL